jgi:class 3 adenylate cyclase
MKMELKGSQEELESWRKKLGTFGRKDGLITYTEANLEPWLTENTHTILGGFDDNYEKRVELQGEIANLNKSLATARRDLSAKGADVLELQKKIESILAEKEKKEKIQHIISRICPEGGSQLLADPEFEKLFLDNSVDECVVVSIDIRRSTELMLKARKPALFSTFITQLSQKLADVIRLNFGVFDKFTGDGILAFFPKRYSGDNAIIRALKAAEMCHAVFKEHYFNCREYFNVFIKDVGLGIGIDFGEATLVNSGNELTVVGVPVVYACRMGATKAGTTLLNQPAKEEICRLINKYVRITETEIEIKNEGRALAYIADIHEHGFEIKPPSWMQKVLAADSEVLPSEVGDVDISNEPPSLLSGDIKATIRKPGTKG